MPRASSKPGRRWPWLILTVTVIVIVAFVALWATGTIY
jgi:Na+/melibiose symporter-like transporter